ncbi:MAG: tetratricopeptide repeat protein [Rhodospirillaceae bacterium]|nr:tetratricopeptide repeat protein [Rhodospirillales bacterium]
MRDVPAASGERFAILIADLEDDDDHLSNTRHIVDALERQPGVEILRANAALKVGDVGRVGDARSESERTGREWLRDKDADVLVWGRVKGHGRSLFLRFLTLEDGLPGQSYGLDESTLELPAAFDKHLAVVLSGAVISAAAPAWKRAGNYLVALLRPVYKRMRALLEQLPKGLEQGHLAELWLSYGLVCGVLANQAGDDEFLQESERGVRMALAQLPREHVPEGWAQTQNNLGAALLRLGEREEGTARLEEAVAAYRAALEVRTRDVLPLDWAQTQNNLGNALLRLGEREEGPAQLEEAVVAYRAALEVRTRVLLPLDWAQTQNNLGAALKRLGEREEGTVRLEEAVVAYRAALEVRTRDLLPLDWAQTQNNLGNALRCLGEREEGTARLEEAVVAYRSAFEVRTRDLLPLDWAQTQNNLGNALMRLGEREERTARLEEAMTAFRGALEIYEQASPHYYAVLVRNNLQRVEAAIVQLNAVLLDT